jgi:hypothetical protein
MPSLPDDLFDDLFFDDLFADFASSPSSTGGSAQALQPVILEPVVWTLGNPLLDGEGFSPPMLIDDVGEGPDGEFWIVDVGGEADGGGVEELQESEASEPDSPAGNPFLD